MYTIIIDSIILMNYAAIARGMDVLGNMFFVRRLPEVWRHTLIDVRLDPRKIRANLLSVRIVLFPWSLVAIFGVIMAARMVRRSEMREDGRSFCRGFGSAAGL